MKRISKSIFFIPFLLLTFCLASLQPLPTVETCFVEGENQDTLIVEPFISLFVQPIRPLYKEINFRIEQKKDSFRSRRISPYYIQISVAARVKSNTENTSILDSLKTIQFDLETKITSETYIPPVLRAPGAPANQPVITNTCGTGRDDRIFILQKTNLKAYRDDMIKAPIGKGTNPTPFVISSQQSNTTTLLLHRDSTYKKSLDNLFIYGGGIVIAVEEVIDPPNWLYFSIKRIRASRDLKEINWIDAKDSIRCVFKKGGINTTCRRFACENKIGPDTLYHISKTKKNQDHHPYSLNAPKDRHAWQIDFCTQKYDYHYNTCDADSNFDKHPPIPLYQSAKFDSLFLGILDEGSDSTSNFLGYVYKDYKFGTYPLFLAEKNNSDSLLPRYRYSICLDNIVADPNYEPKSILCYVFPPKKEVNPCPID